MPTVAQYRQALEKAQTAGDDEAVQYFQGQLTKAGSVQSGMSGRDHGALNTTGTAADSALQGLTFGFSDELAGVGGGIASTLMGEGFGKGYGEIKDWVSDRAKDYNARHPWLGTGAEIAGGLAFPLGAIRSVGSALRTGAGAGALYGAGKSETDEDAPIGERVKDFATDTAMGAAGGAGGAAALRGLSALGRSIFPQASLRGQTPEYRANVDRLRNAGVRTTAGARLDNPSVRQSEEVLARFMANPNAQREPGQQLMRELMRRANFAPEDAAAGTLSREAAERAADRFSQGYDRALRNVTVDMPNMDPLLARIEAGVSQLMNHEQRANIRTILRDFRTRVQTGAQITGRDYKRLRSNIGKMQTRAARSDRDAYLAPVYGALRQTLDDAFRQAAPRRAADALRGLDRRYGAFKLLQEQAQGRARPEEFIGTLANKARQNRGRVDRDFVDLVNAFDDVYLRGGWKSSGTPEGMAALTNVVPPIPAMVRTAGANVTDAVRQVVPLNFPLPQQMGAFIAGQQAPEMVESLF